MSTATDSLFSIKELLTKYNFIDVVTTDECMLIMYRGGYIDRLTSGEARIKGKGLTVSVRVKSDGLVVLGWRDEFAKVERALHATGYDVLKISDGVIIMIKGLQLSLIHI